jgi:hypothetical protein
MILAISLMFLLLVAGQLALAIAVQVGAVAVWIYIEGTSQCTSS